MKVNSTDVSIKILPTKECLIADIAAGEIAQFFRITLHDTPNLSVACMFNPQTNTGYIRLEEIEHCLSVFMNTEKVK